MPYMRLHSPPLAPALRAELAAALTDLVVRLMADPSGRGPSPDELRGHTTVHFTPWQPDEFAIGGRLMSETGGADHTLEFSDWGLSKRRQRVLARELTATLAERLGVDDLDQVNIRFHRYDPRDFAVAGRLLADRIPRAGRIGKRLGG